MNIESIMAILHTLTGKIYQKSACGTQLVAKGERFPEYSITKCDGYYTLRYFKYSKFVNESEITINEIARRINFLETGNPILEIEWGDA